jgi:hypothetical protein
MERSMTTYMRRVSAVVLMCFVATACTKELRKHLNEKVAQNQTRGDTDGNSCSLLDSAEVTAAIGPLAGPPYRGGPIPDASGETCRYDSQDYRRIRVNVDWSGGAMAMKMASFGREPMGQPLGCPLGCPYGSYFVTRAPTSFAIAASVVCAAFNPSRKSSSLYVL